MNRKQNNQENNQDGPARDAVDGASLNETSLHKDREKWMGDQLRRVYDDVVNEPIPAELQQLVDQLDSQSSDKGTPDDG